MTKIEKNWSLMGINWDQPVFSQPIVQKKKEL